MRYGCKEWRVRNGCLPCRVGEAYDTQVRLSKMKFLLKGETTMSGRAKSVVPTLLVALALSLPLGAQNDTANATMPIVKDHMTCNRCTSLAGTALKPGTYTVVADGSKVTLSQHKKKVAEAPIQWKDEQGKARHSTIVTESDGRVTEVHFRGQTQYVAIAH